MPADLLGEMVGGVLRGVARFAAELFLNVIVEIGVQGAGYVICKPFKPDIKPDGWVSTCVGATFWMVVAALAHVTWKRVS